MQMDDAKYRAEFEAEPSYRKSMSVEEYIQMRRIDDGKDDLKANSSTIAKAKQPGSVTEMALHSENAKYVAEYNAEQSYQNNMTLAAYIKMRRVDDGLDQLPTGVVQQDERNSNQA